MGKIWKFTFRMDSTDILIHDATSAENFIKLLGKDLASYWDLKMTEEPGAPTEPAELALLDEPSSANLRAAPEESILPGSNPAQETPPRPARAAQVKAIPARPAAATPRPEPVAQEARPGAVEYAKRRRHPRLPVQMNVIVVSGGRCLMTTTQDVSEGGIRILHSFREKLGAERSCQVFVKSPDGKEKIAFTAQLVDSDNGSCRLAFLQPAEHQKARFQDWVRQLQAAGPKAPFRAA